MAYLHPARGEAREGGRAAAVAPVTNTNGTADGTIADVGEEFNQATLNDNFRECSDKINEMIAALKSAGLMA